MALPSRRERAFPPAPGAELPHRPAPLAIWAALACIYLVWGGTYLAIRFAVQTMPPFLMAAFRFITAGGSVYLWRRLRGDPAPTGRQWLAAMVVGAFLLVGGNGCVVWAEQRVDSAIAALLVSTVPLWMVLIDAFLPGGRRPSGWVYFGIVLGLGGIVVLIGPQQLAGGSAIDLLGALALLAGSLSWAIGSLYSRRANLPVSPLLATGMQMLAGGCGLLLLGTAAGDWGRLDLAAISARSLAGLAYLIVVSSWIGFTAYNWLLRAAPISLVSTYAYVNPVVAIFLGWLLGQEEMTPRTLAAAAVIIGAVVLITVFQPAGRPAPAHAPPAAADTPSGDVPSAGDAGQSPLTAEMGGTPKKKLSSNHEGTRTP